MDKRQSSSNYALLVLILVTTWLLPITYVLSDILAFADYLLPVWVSSIGTVSTIAGLWLICRAHVDLGRNWSPVVAAHSEHPLKTDGVYKYVRHPMYLAFFIFHGSQALFIHNLIACALAPVTMVIMYVLRIREEEKLMHDVFGDEYVDYCSRTGCLVPKISSYGSAST